MPRAFLLALTALITACRSQTPITELVTQTPTARTAQFVIETITSTQAESQEMTATAPVTHTISVGAAGHKFTPKETTAAVGDTLEYRFYPDDHWVIRGDFDNPCIPYEDVGTSRDGFSSGPQPVEAITEDAPRFRVRVNDTEPIFYYCGAAGSCVDNNMMGVVNPTNNQTLDGYLKNAEHVDFQLRPGEPWPKGGEETTASSTTSPTAPPGGPNDGNHGDHGDHDNEDDKDSSPHSNAIAGIAVGGAALLILISALFLWLWRTPRHVPRRCPRRGGFTPQRPPRPEHPSPPPMADAVLRPQPAQSSAPLWPEQPSPWLERPRPVNGQPYYTPRQPSPLGPVMGSNPPPPPPSPRPPPIYGFPPARLPPRPDYDDSHVRMFSPPIQWQMGGSPPPTKSSKADLRVRPIELPSSRDPGNSPLPAYTPTPAPANRMFSWADEDERGYYRPSKGGT